MRKFKFSGILVAIALAASALSGCNIQHQEENSQPTIQTVSDTTVTSVSSTAENEAPQSKAISAYKELLEACPAVSDDCDELNDLAFGYDENLAEFGNHYDYFAISDLNNDGIPELIATTIINYKWTPVSIFTYSSNTSDDANVNINSDIILLKDSLAPESHATFEQMCTAGGKYDLFICKDNHIHNVWSGDTPAGYQVENQAYVLNGAELEAVECGMGFSDEIKPDDIVVDFSETACKNTEENRNAMLGTISD